MLPDGPVEPPANVTIAQGGLLRSFQPVLAMSSRRPDVLVLVDGDCQIRRSTDGGRSWSAPAPAPRMTTGSTCAAPTLAYSSDGSRLYLAYVDARSTAPRITVSSIAMAYSDDDGKTFGAAAAVGLPQGSTNPGHTFIGVGRPSIGTHVDAAQREWVYAAADYVFSRPVVSTYDLPVVRSGARGAAGSWEQAGSLESSSYNGTPMPFAHPAGVQVRGGAGGEVLAAWYYSDVNLPTFEIHTRRSPDHGKTWGPITTAVKGATSVHAALPPWDCALNAVWFEGMHPSLALDAAGVAHLLYTEDPVAGILTAEEGDVRYAASAGPPYAAWSTPVTVNDDGLGRAQGLPSIHVEERAGAARVHALWMDLRNAPAVPLDCPSRPQRLYDIYHAVRSPAGWSASRRISSVSSITAEELAGGIGLAGSGGLVFGVWNDRRPLPGTETPDPAIRGAAVPLP